MFRRRSLVVVGIALASLGASQVLLGSAGAAVVSQAYTATGTVANPHAAFDNSTPVDGEIDSFLLDPVSSASDSATPYETPDANGNPTLQVYVTPSTGYYGLDSSGVYHRKAYSDVVVKNQDVKVVGDRYTRDNGTVRFVAKFVYNPPPTTDFGGASYNVKCGSGQNMRYTGFTVGAVISQKGIHYPCTGGSASDPLGFQVNQFTDPPQYLVTQAIQDFGDRLEINILPTTKYISGDKASNSNVVLRAGNGVRVFGNYVKYANGWTFDAKTVWSPDPLNGAAQPRRIDEYADSITQDASTPGHYSGVVDRGGNAFLNGSFSADLVWSAADGGGYTVSGTWTMTALNQKDILRGTLTGQTSGSSGLDMSLEVTSGEGQFFGVTGGGDFEGAYSLNGTSPPSAFGGHFIIVVVPNPGP